MSPIMRDWLEKGKVFQEKLVVIRRDFHQHPEIGFEEKRTRKRLIEHLEAIGLIVQAPMARTGVVALLEGDKPGKTIAIRADMDALPMEELAKHPYQSQSPGRMHACGHDAHMTYVLGAAMILKELKSELCGNVKFIFQPAEETTGGAKPMIDEGVLENPKVDAILGGHVWPGVPSGSIEVVKGPVMASTGQINIELQGKGGHAASPHENSDPIQMATEILQKLQNFVSRGVDPLENLVISICSFHSGETFNIMPEKAVLKGTVRTLNNELRLGLEEKMHKLIKSVTDYHGGSYQFELQHLYPATVNDPEFTDFAKTSIRDLIGEDHVQVGTKPSMAGEDFAFYLEKIPGTFLRIGNYSKEKGLIYNLHNPYFDIDEEQLGKIASIYAKVAYDFLNHQ